MRRSAAPSMLSAAKKPRFVTPFKSGAVNSSKPGLGDEKPADSILGKDSRVETVIRENVTHLNRKPTEVLAPGGSDKRQMEIEKEKENLPNPRKCYYSVMWCKLSRKKHKKWEGDAILVTDGRTATLKDMEGKDIAKSSGYKSSDIASMEEGSTLAIGGKEIEVMNVIPESDWHSGKCFAGSVASSSSVTSSSIINEPVVRRLSSKPRPFISSGFSGGRSTMGQARPLFDPKASDALVMPQPNQHHQWEFNKGGFPVVDVVVDPHIGKQLRPHQREGVLFLYECVMGMRSVSGQGAILADEMGLGKTIQCIALLWTLLKQGVYGGKPVVRKALVITPSSLVKNWQKEIRKWLGNERLKAYAVGKDQEALDFCRGFYPVMIISYEMFLRCHQQIKDVKFDIVICDEGHRLKNANIKTTAAIMELPTRRRILLTGTPIQNDLLEFFALVDFCNPGVLGSASSFHRVYDEPILRSRQSDRSDEEKELGRARADELHRITSLFCLRRTQEINRKYLPPKVESVLFCKPTSLQLALYRKLLASRMVKSCLTSYAMDSGSAPHLLCIDALKKLCNSPSLIFSAARERAAREGEGFSEDSLYSDLSRAFPSLYTDEESLHTDDCGKMQTLVQMWDHLNTIDGEKVVVVSNYTKTLDLLQLQCQRLNYSFLRLDGSTPSGLRMSIVEKFNRPDDSHFIFLLSSKAGGVGLNLTGASRLILYDVDWNPANDMQAMARVWRDGQKKTVRIYRLLTTGTIEEKMYQRQIMKQGLSGAVVDAGLRSESKSHFTREELKDLFTLREATSCDTLDLLLRSTESEPTAAVAAKQEVVRRSCQLGTASREGNSSKKRAVYEVLSWRRYGEPIRQSTLKDETILCAESTVTFVFQNESNSHKD
eukprot:m.229567 g.229567  ORF g.229567 m.229567 type:complete len:886 (+) comp40045_c0_seq52:113-2770(+)